MKSYFEMQTKLLLKVLGTAVESPYFVLKGGTAINFFHNNFPRLSVDIDLTYTKITSREEFLIDNNTLWQSLLTELPLKHSVAAKLHRTKDGIPKQMIISSQNAEIKIEANLVLRGTIYPTIMIESCEAIDTKYGIKHRVNTLAIEELYAGKFCAALDRQHPRDLFDLLIFFENHEISQRLKIAFLVYLISANRPIAELINPSRLNQELLYKNEFLGMTNRRVPYSSLTEARETLICELNKAINQKDRSFLLSFKQGKPAWEHLDLEHVKNMPAIKWKLQNIARMDPQKHMLALSKLEKKLGL